jgi:hypothetical protein
VSGTPIETRIRDRIQSLIDDEMTVPGYNFDMADFAVTVAANEEKNEDQGDLERFEGMGIPENRRTIKAGLYRNVLLFAIRIDFAGDQNADFAAKVADDWKKAFGTFPQLNNGSASGAFEAQYLRYVKIAGGAPGAFGAIDFFVHIRYRQRRTEPETAG